VVIITAAGAASRWGKPLPKHLTVIEGETLLARTVRLVREIEPKAEIVISGPADERYKVPGSTLFTPIERPDDLECSMYTWTRRLWDRNGRTTYLYGDVFYSEPAIARIMSFSDPEWHVWGRLKGNKVKWYPEIWSHSFWPEHHATEDMSIREVVRRARAGALRRASIYEMYKWQFGKHLPWTWAQWDLGRFSEINDATEDFDTPEDFEKWQRTW
jgi:MobA-like NTP transferase domain